MRFEAAWVYLFVAGLLEIIWAIGLKYTEGFSRLWPSVITVLAMIASFALLAQALKTIPVGTGYAVWTGIGAAGTAILGMVFLGDRLRFYVFSASDLLSWASSASSLRLRPSNGAFIR